MHVINTHARTATMCCSQRSELASVAYLDVFFGDSGVAYLDEKPGREQCGRMMCAMFLFITKGISPPCYLMSC